MCALGPGQLAGQPEKAAGGTPDLSAFPQKIQVDCARVWNAKGKLVFDDEFNDSKKKQAPMVAGLRKELDEAGLFDSCLKSGALTCRAVTAVSRYIGL